jgi:hypothetical protein
MIILVARDREIVGLSAGSWAAGPSWLAYW